MADDERLDKLVELVRSNYRKNWSLPQFLKESNQIEGIYDYPSDDQLNESSAFLSQDKVTVALLERLAKIFANAELRRRPGMNVVIGNHRPLSGGPMVEDELQFLCDDINAGMLTPFKAHVRFEVLHPFIDGNGRVGRLLWLWMRKGDAPLGFLQHFYYEALAAASGPVDPNVV